MRVNWNLIKLILVVVSSVLLYAFATERNSSRLTSEPIIKFNNESKPFVTRDAVNKLLIQNKDSVTSTPKEKLDLNKMEFLVNSHPIVNSAEVFLSIDGEIGVQIRQRVPIARINGSTSFYLDEQGFKMPLSDNYTARVPIVTGIGDQNLSEVFELIKFFNNDEFFKKHFVGINKISENNYTLNPRTLDYTIDLGPIENLNLKLTNYKAFYKKALKDVSLENYKRISLKYENQVVCTKK